MKKCPFCAEKIQDEAIVCRYCGRDLPATGRPSKAVTTRKGKLPAAITSRDSTNLPDNYVPPEADIETIYRAGVKELREGAFLVSAASIMAMVPPGLNSKKALKLFPEIASEAWSKSDNTPEGAIEWLSSFRASRLKQQGVFSDKRSLEAGWATERASDIFARYTVEEVRRTYTNLLKGLLASTIQSSQDNQKALQHLDLYEKSSQEIPAPYKPLIYAEARRHIASVHITGEDYVVPPEKRERFFEDLDHVVERVVILVERQHKGRTSNISFEGMLSNEEFEQAIADVVAGDSRYADSFGRMFVRMRAKGRLPGYGIFDEETLRAQGLR